MTSTGRGIGVSWLVRLLLASLLLLPTAGAVPIRGEFTGPIETIKEARLEVQRAGSLLEAVPEDVGATPELLWSSFSRVYVWETRVVKVQNPAGNGSIGQVRNPTSQLGDRPIPKAAYFSNDTRVTLSDVHEDARLIVDATLSNDDTQVRLDGLCRFEPGGAKFIRPQPGAGLQWPGPTPTVPHGYATATCVASFAAVVNPASVLFYGTTVRLVDSDGRDERIRTGLFVEASGRPQDPTVEVVARVLEVRQWQEEPIRFELRGDFKSTWRSRTFVAEGELRVPEATLASLEWGDFRREGTATDLGPTGVFAIRGVGSTKLGLDGETSNAPPATTAARSASFAASGALVGVAALAAAVGVAAYVSRHALHALALTLFSRFTPNQVLEDERRRLIMEITSQAPGIPIRDLATRLALPYGTVLHHVRALNRKGHLIVRRFGRATSLFVRGGVAPNQQAVYFRLRNEHIRRILRGICQNSYSTQADLAKVAGVSQPYVCKVLRGLQAEGVVEVRREGNRFVYLASEVAKRLFGAVE